jgi:hypothetical protein
MAESLAPGDLICPKCYDDSVRWLHTTLAVLLILAIGCLPFCAPRACTHSCCSSHSGDCGSSVDLNPALGCARSAAATVPVGPHRDPAPLLVSAHSTACQRSNPDFHDGLLRDGPGAHAARTLVFPLRI